MFFTVYQDKSFFQRTSIIGSIGSDAASFGFPSSIVIPVQGYDCATLSSDRSKLYMLSSHTYLQDYTINPSNLNSISFEESNIIDCYYDPGTNTLNFVRDSYDIRSLDLSNMN